MSAPIRSQRGVAAIEFAIVFVVLFTALHGIANWSAALYIHQVVARAAEDGARAAAMAPVESAASGAAIRSARRSLAASLVIPLDEHATSAAARLAWVTAHVDVDVLPSTGSLTVTVSYPYAEHPLLPSVSLVKGLMPQTLRSSATTAIAS